MPPNRIQLSRRKGWRLPANAVVVARPTRWGNPFVIGQHGTRAECVALYARLIDGEPYMVADNRLAQASTLAHVRTHIGELRGRDLACWCPPGEPCHADVLLGLANR